MDSLAHISLPLASRLLPFWAVTQEDLRSVLRHWALWAWLAVGLGLPALWLSTTIPAAASAPPATTASGESFGAPHETPRFLHGNLKETHAGSAGIAAEGTLSGFGGRVLAMQILLCATFALALGATAVSGEADVASDAILCRGIARWQYFLAKSLSRCLAVFLVVALLSMTAITAASLRLPNDVALAGLWSAIQTTGAVLVSAALLGVALGSWFHSPMVGVAVVWMMVYGVGLVATILELRELSPILFAEQLPQVLTGRLEALAYGQWLVKGSLYGAAAAAAAALIRFSTRDA